MLVFNQIHQSNINAHINANQLNLSKSVEGGRTQILKRLSFENKEYLKYLGFLLKVN